MCLSELILEPEKGCFTTLTAPGPCLVVWPDFLVERPVRSLREASSMFGRLPEVVLKLHKNISTVFHCYRSNKRPQYQRTVRTTTINSPTMINSGSKKSVASVHRSKVSPKWGGNIIVTDPDYKFTDPFIFAVSHAHRKNSLGVRY